MTRFQVGEKCGKMGQIWSGYRQSPVNFQTIVLLQSTIIMLSSWSYRATCILSVSSCRPSVCLSVCDTVQCDCQGCTVTIHWHTGPKVVPACYLLAGKFLFVRLATKHTKENESKKTLTWVFWDRQSAWIRRALVVLRLLFTDFVNFGRSRLSGLCLGVFINSTRWIGLCVPAVRHVTETGLIVRQYTVRRKQYDRLSQKQLSFL